MANKQHLDILKQGVVSWNLWRKKNLNVRPDLFEADLSRTNLHNANLRDTMLSKADLRGANLSEANLSQAILQEAILQEANLSKAILSQTILRGANLTQADFSQANLFKANLSQAILHETIFHEASLNQANLSEASLNQANLFKANLARVNLFKANLSGANLSQSVLSQANLGGADLTQANFNGANLNHVCFRGANLRGADLSGTNMSAADLRGANLNRANLSGANLTTAVLVGANLKNANLTSCYIYGISAWDVKLDGTIQSSLIITLPYKPMITVDNLEVAQFIYLLLNNKKIRDVIDTITSKVVLILGRFTPERKALLDALRDELRKRNYSPVIFDFEKPSSRDFTETVRTLAHMSRFIIADLTDPSSIPQELQAIVPELEVPVQPLLLEAQKEYTMFVDFRKYHWVLPIYLYKDLSSLLTALKENVIDPAEKMVAELAREKAKRLARQ
jgi:uncharacterized protein YjbI with pentapeptide repeats